VSVRFHGVCARWGRDAIIDIMTFFAKVTPFIMLLSPPRATTFLPITGASVVIIMANYLKKGDEHREYFGCAVESMGGRWVRGLRVDGGTITHAIWIDADDLTRDPSRLTSQTLANLNTCLKRDIPGEHVNENKIA
jgi:hypothetical protein